MNLVLEDRYESTLSIDTKKSASSPLFDNDVLMTSESRKLDFTVLDENRQNFKFSPKNLGICDFNLGFRLIQKGNDYYNIHRKFQVHILVFGAKANIARWQPPPLPLTLKGSKIFCIKITEKDDPTISCSHLMVELSVLAGQKINLKGVVTTPFGRRGLKHKAC